jgi:hypothetical protein
MSATVTIVPGDRVLGVCTFGTVEGVYQGQGMQDDGTRYALVIDDLGRRRELPLPIPGQSNGFQFYRFD